jgi:predicted acylesterase/phospholipase RssA
MSEIPKVQRALVLQGGGALGAYEAGVLKTLYKKLTIEDEEKDKKGKKGGLLFDIVAGTSIGAINGAVLVSNVISREKSWKSAVDTLEHFWIDESKETEEDKGGLASTIDIDKLSSLDPWQKDEEWYEKQNAASKEAARRYYSAKMLFLSGAPNVHKLLPVRPDFRFLDNSDFNKWFIHNSEPLEKSIKRYCGNNDKNNNKKSKIFTSWDKKQPRLLVVAVDVAEGKTVTFDSYKKIKDYRKSGHENHSNTKGQENYGMKSEDNGITMDHVMASGTLPEFYDYRYINGRKFWDGGLLSNTPFRELLQAHQDYWMDVISQQDEDGKVPDLEVYIVNLHPSKCANPPDDHDGTKDRLNDITFFDRNSHFDENMSYLVTDYTDFVIRMKDIAMNAISKISNGNDKAKLQEKLEAILETTAHSKSNKEEYLKYKDLLKGRFELTKVIRIERTNYINSIWLKGGDFTSETIKKLIKEGESDAWVILIEQDVKNLPLPDDNIGIKDILIEHLHQALEYLKNDDFQDDAYMYAYNKLTEFICQTDRNKLVIDRLKSGQSDDLIKSAEMFKTSLEQR